MNNMWYEVPPSAYLSYNLQSSTSTLLIGAYSDNSWVLGLPFLSSYYSIWDNNGGTTGQIGLVLSSFSTASITPASTLPTRVFDSASDPSVVFWNSFILISEVAAGIVASMFVGGTVSLIVFVLLYEARLIDYNGVYTFLGREQQLV